MAELLQQLDSRLGRELPKRSHRKRSHLPGRSRHEFAERNAPDVETAAPGCRQQFIRLGWRLRETQKLRELRDPARKKLLRVIDRGRIEQKDNDRCRERDADQLRERDEAHELRGDAARNQPLRPSHQICSTAGVNR
ncbi:MAG: hypothetical protein ACI4XG_09885 [Bradyrhizobium sp.]